VQRRTDHAVCAFANNILDVILFADVERDLAGTALRSGTRHLVGIVMCSRYGGEGESGERSCRKRDVAFAVAQLLGASATTAEGAMEGVKCDLLTGVCSRGRVVSSRRESCVTETSDQQFFPVASSCPTCGMQHAQSDLQATCVAHQPLPHSVHACKRRSEVE
jgi:hypothetical protein